MNTDVTITLPPFDDSPFEFEYPSVLHNIYVKSILSDDEAEKSLRLAMDYAETTRCWDQPDAARHASYATCDFAVEDCHSLQSYLDEIGFDSRIWDHLSALYGINHEDMSYLDFFCAHYQSNDDAQAVLGKKTMDRLVDHRDGSLLSFTVTLSDPDDFEGGGTCFDALRDVEPTCSVLKPNGVVRPFRAGDGVLHSGKILHGADVVRSGKRTVLVGFIDVSDWLFRPGALSTACKDWGRMDVAALRWKRQQKMTNGGSGISSATKSCWPMQHARWLPRSPRDSFARGFVPAFGSVGRRADVDFQRRRRLEAEDRLLRSILLPASDVPNVLIGQEYFIGDDISILPESLLG
jgi:hypothetical protein